MKRREAIRSLLSVSGSEQSDERVEEQLDIAPKHTPAGSIRSMGLSLDRLTEEAEAGRLLKEQLSAGSSIHELDPAVIVPSFVTDRLAIAEDPSFDLLIDSIRQNGQLVPILVRPHPDRADRFQVAYGHRRLRTAELLGTKVRAVVRELTDEELVVAQGKENSERKDLTFIERALFAQHLDDRGFSRSVVMTALSVDSAEVTRLLTVARSIPKLIVDAIGSAPKAGRPRWLELATLINDKTQETRIGAVIGSDTFKRLGSDRRFEMLYNVLSSETDIREPAQHWADPKGRRIVKIEHGLRQVRLSFDQKLEPQFGRFVAEKLDDLYSEFQSRVGEAESSETLD